MSKHDARRASAAWQWNPPPREEMADEGFHTRKQVQSAT